MKKITFEFLATMELKEIEKPITQVNAAKQPGLGADLRLFSDGGIYPSEALIILDQLEHQPKDSDKPSYGYDVFVSTDWAQYPQGAPQIVCIAKVSKHSSRVDLFGKAKFDDKGNPKSLVGLQRNTSGEELIKMLETAYCELGETLFDGGKTFVDLKIVRDAAIKPVSNGIYLLPKKLVKGAKSGTPIVERRENIQVYALQVLEHANGVKPPATIVASAPEKTALTLPSTPVQEKTVAEVAEALFK